MHKDGESHFWRRGSTKLNEQNCGDCFEFSEHVYIFSIRLNFPPNFLNLATLTGARKEGFSFSP